MLLKKYQQQTQPQLTTSRLKKTNAPTWLNCLLITTFALLSACGSDNKHADTSQVVAKVNDSEVTIHQLNLELTDQRLANQPDKGEVRRAVLERLIDQTLLVDKALEKKLNRNPITMQAIERAKRQVLAQAYMQSILGSVPQPSASEVNQFYDAHPELFTKRRVYQLQQLTFSNSVDKDDIRKHLEKAKKLSDFTRWVKKNKIKARHQTIIRGAERISTLVLSKIKDQPQGKGVFIEGTHGAIAVWIIASNASPLSKEQANPFIVKHLTTKKRNAAIQQEIQRLRSVSQVTYLSGFAAVKTVSKELNESRVPVSDRKNPDTDTLFDKGISGLK